jgi:hypothetical protein
MSGKNDAALMSADGIMNCLRLLAEEAATLNLQRTLWAIQEAMAATASEADLQPAPELLRFEGGTPLKLH